MPLFKKPLKENTFALVAKCEGGDHPAYFGFGVDLRGKKGGQWWCDTADGEGFCKKERLL